MFLCNFYCSCHFFESFFPVLLFGASLDQTYGGVCGHRPRCSGDRIAESDCLSKNKKTEKNKEGSHSLLGCRPFSLFLSVSYHLWWCWWFNGTPTYWEGVPDIFKSRLFLFLTLILRRLLWLIVRGLRFGFVILLRRLGLIFLINRLWLYGWYNRLGLGLCFCVNTELVSSA